MNDDLDRLLLLRDDADRAVPIRPAPQGSPAFVGKVVSTGTNIAAGKFLLVNPVEVSGTPAEGGAGTYATDTTRTIPVYLVGGTPATGDYLVCRFVDYRWAAEKRAGTAPTGHTACICTNVPDAITATSQQFGGIVTTFAMQFYTSQAVPGPTIPSGAWNGPGYYGAPTAISPTLTSTPLIRCLGSQFTFAQATTFTSNGNLAGGGSSWLWNVIQGTGSSCSPFLLSGGAATNPTSANQIQSFTASG